MRRVSEADGVSYQRPQLQCDTQKAEIGDKWQQYYLKNAVREAVRSEREQIRRYTCCNHKVTIGLSRPCCNRHGSAYSCSTNGGLTRDAVFDVCEGTDAFDTDKYDRNFGPMKSLPLTTIGLAIHQTSSLPPA